MACSFVFRDQPGRQGQVRRPPQGLSPFRPPITALPHHARGSVLALCPRPWTSPQLQPDSRRSDRGDQRPPAAVDGRADANRCSASYEACRPPVTASTLRCEGGYATPRGTRRRARAGGAHRPDAVLFGRRAGEPASRGGRMLQPSRRPCARCPTFARRVHANPSGHGRGRGRRTVSCLLPRHTVLRYYALRRKYRASRRPATPPPHPLPDHRPDGSPRPPVDIVVLSTCLCRANEKLPASPPERPGGPGMSPRRRPRPTARGTEEQGAAGERAHLIMVVSSWPAAAAAYFFLFTERPGREPSRAMADPGAGLCHWPAAGT